MENSGKKKAIISICFMLLLIVLIVGGYYFYKEYNKPTPEENGDNKEVTKAAIEKEDTTNYTNTMSYDVYKTVGGYDYVFLKKGNKPDGDYELVENDVIKIEGKAEDAVIYNIVSFFDENQYEPELWKYFVYKDNNKIKVYDAEKNESYILNIPVGEKYNHYGLVNELADEKIDRSEILYVAAFSSKDDRSALIGVLENSITSFSSWDEELKPFDLLVVKNNKFLHNVYNTDYDYSKGYVLYQGENGMEVYSIVDGTSKKVNIPVKIGDSNLGMCFGDYKNYISCMYSFKKDQSTFYHRALYSFKLDKVLYQNKYDSFHVITDDYMLGVKYECNYSASGNDVERECTGKTVDVVSLSEEKVLKSIDISKYKYDDIQLHVYGKNYFCFEEETMESTNCLETYAIGKEVKLLVKGKTQKTKKSKDGNLCVLKDNTLTIYNANGKVISSEKNKKISDCK